MPYKLIQKSMDLRVGPLKKPLDDVFKKDIELLSEMSMSSALQQVLQAFWLLVGGEKDVVAREQGGEESAKSQWHVVLRVCYERIY